MKDTDKNKEELLAEIASLNRRIEMLQKTEADRYKSMEEALRESEAKYRQLVEYAPAAIWEIDLTTGKFINVNDVACEYSGYTKEEFLELRPWDILTEESLNKQLERYDKILPAKRPAQERKCAGDGFGCLVDCPRICHAQDRPPYSRKEIQRISTK